MMRGMDDMDARAAARGPRSWGRLLVPAVLVVGWLWPAAPAPAGPPTPLGRETGRAWNLLSARALVVAKLARRARGPDRAFVVFEEQRVVRGDSPGRRLVFPGPEKSPPIPESAEPPAITEADLRQLEEGGTYLIVVDVGDPPGLWRWRRLAGGPDDDKVLADELKPYAELDRVLKLDPWATAGSGTPVEQGCVHAWYGRFAPAAAVNALLAEYPKLNRLTFDQQSLAYEALSRPRWEDLRLSPDVLRAAYDAPDRGGDDAARRMTPVVRQEALRRLGRADDPKYDDVFAAAVSDADPQTRTAALEALTERKQPAAVPAIRKAFKAGGTEGVWAARALARQSGEAGVAEVLEACAKDLALLAADPNPLFAVEEQVGKANVPALRALDNPADVRLHRQVVRLLVTAGDEKAIEDVRRLGATGEWNDLPNYGDPRLVRHAHAWAPTARRWLQQGGGNGAGVVAAFQVLRAANDPDLPDLLAAAAAHEHVRRQALKQLQEVATERQREQFKALAAGVAPELRVYGWAGLGRLGDQAALARVAEAAWLAPDSRTRFAVAENVVSTAILSTFDPAVLLAAWNAHDPGTPGTEAKPDADAHGYVAAQLERLVAARKAAPAGK